MSDALERGRELYRQNAWAQARLHLAEADAAAPLCPDDLQVLATCAYLVGCEQDFRTVLERAHHDWLERGEVERAARCGFWIGLSLLLGGASGPATGWLARATRLVEGRDCVERGYLSIPEAERQLGTGQLEAALETATEAASVGERFADADLLACARHLRGRVLLRDGKLEPGIALLDEAMVAAVAGELSPIMTGLIYCSVIEACQAVHAVGRAREWTAAFAGWCERQPEMIAFTTTCLVQRAAILRRHGRWPEALEEATRAGDFPSQGLERAPCAAAMVQAGEIYRLRGQLDRAEEAFVRASHGGGDPQPGLALLWLARGRTGAAAAAIRRVLEATPDRLERGPLLAAAVEIFLAVDDEDAAREAAAQLRGTADDHPSDALDAMAAFGQGLVDLQYGDPRSALIALRSALATWRECDMPYAVARARGTMGLCCRALGDEAGASLELEAARRAFEMLGAARDAAWAEQRLREEATPAPHGLSPRELEVLRLLTTGRTNRDLASELGVSEKTIERHLSNMFRKLNVQSRTAATSYAYEHHLV